MKLGFLDLFPPPDFLTMPAIGISFESEIVRVVSFDRRHGHNSLKKSTEYKLEPGTLIGGEIVKADKLVAVLQTIRNDYKAHFARVAIPEEKAYVYETVIPVPEEGDLSEAVEFSLDQNIPLTPAEAVFDFAVVEGPFSNAGVQSVRVVVTAYSRSIAESWIDVLTKAGIQSLVLTPESQAIARSLVPVGDKRSVLLVHFLKDKTVIAVVSEGFVRFTTTVSNSVENVEKILRSHEGEKISESVELLSVRDEVQKVYSYWKSRPASKSRKDSGTVSSLIVSGQVSEMSDVSEYLGKFIGVPAKLGNVWQNAFSLDQVIPSIEFENSLVLSAAVGVALPH